MNIFKNLFKEMDAQNVQPITPKQTLSQKHLIEMCHADFYSEVDKLLAQANIQKSQYDESLQHKAKLLRKVGFNSNNEVIEKADKQVEQVSVQTELIEAIQHFSFKYPQQKFITEESVTKICNKYGLIWGDVQYYTKDVPNENLNTIANFNKDIEEWCYGIRFDGFRGSSGFDVKLSQRDKEEMERQKQLEQYYIEERDRFFEEGRLREWQEMLRGGVGSDWSGFKNPQRSSRKVAEPFYIVAPKTDFNLSRMDIDEKTKAIVGIIKDDPIVLAPVCYNKKRYFLVVTAWGLEAQDELVFNGNHN